MVRARFFSQFLLTAVAYFITAKFSLYLALSPGYASALWPPAAIALCAILIWGKALLPAIWIGATFANMMAGVSLITAALIGVGNSLEALLAALLIQRLLGRVLDFSLSENVYKFIAIAAVSSVIAATIGVANLALVRHIVSSQIMLNWITWWIGDATGIIVFAPLILTWNKQTHRTLRFSRLAEIALFGITLLGVSDLIFSEVPAKWAMPYVMLTFVSWSAFRYGLPGVIRTVAIISVVAIYDTANGLGPFASNGTLNESLLMLQLFLSIIWIVGVAQAALLEQRTRAEDALRHERSDLEVRVKERTVALELEISEIMRLEKTLQKSEHQLAEAQRLAHLGSWDWDISDNKVAWSDELYRVFGIDRNGQFNSLEHYLGLVHPDDLQMTKDVIDHAMQTHEPYKFMHRVIMADGSVKTLIGRGFVQTDKNGLAIRMYGTAQDVTELKTAEDRLRETEKRYQKVVELSPNGIMIVDECGHPLFANSAALSLYGVESTELFHQQSLFDFLDPGYQDTFSKRLHEIIVSTEACTFEKRFIKPDGTIIDVEMTATNFMNGSQRAILIIVTDITERKTLNHNLLLAAQVFENSREGMLILDKNKKIIRANDAFSAISGCAAHEMIGDTRNIMRSPIYDDTFYQRIWDEVHAKNHWEDEVLCQRTDGQSYIASASISAVRNIDGAIDNYIAIFSDITQRKEGSGSAYSIYG